MFEKINQNHPRRFWQIADPFFFDEEWENAYSAVSLDLFGSGSPVISFMNKVLLERQFSQNHWHLSRPKKFFYQLKPFIPRFLQIALRKIYRSSQDKNRLLNWPIEDCYVRFQYALVRWLMEAKGLSEVPYIAFWPEGKDFAFVLTHDVETKEGFETIPILVEVDKKYGFRSIFNIVPERYSIERSYLDNLRAEGFEIGIHGLKHDGKLFFSFNTFSKRAKRINDYLKEYGAKGFRSPLTHRNPEWMQELEIDYDMSFFDTDLFEPIPGGTMSIWPFFMGHFIELPYTLPQDNTLFNILGHKDISIWKEKVDFIEKYHGMALVIVHPDYQRASKGRVKESMYPIEHYKELLRYVKSKGNYWHALPSEVADWWRRRHGSEIKFNSAGKPHIEGPADKDGTIEWATLLNGKLVFKNSRKYCNCG